MDQNDRQPEGEAKNPERGHPSDMPGGDPATPGSQASAGTKYAGEPGPAGTRGENHMDPLRVVKDADPKKP